MLPPQLMLVGGCCTRFANGTPNEAGKPTFCLLSSNTRSYHEPNATCYSMIAAAIAKGCTLLLRVDMVLK